MFHPNEFDDLLIDPAFPEGQIVAFSERSKGVPNHFHNRNQPKTI
jgi:hypothetical protein